jgi:hypothetical protein
MNKFDEAFMSFQQIVDGMLSFRGDWVDEEMGVHSYIYECEIDTPLELDVVWDEEGELQIGSTPPLYNVSTTFLPSFHRLRFTAHRIQDTDDSY